MGGPRVTAPKASGWVCRVRGCHLAGKRQPAPTYRLALAAADNHYADRHATAPPEDLEERRAAWVKAGRPPLGLLG